VLFGVLVDIMSLYTSMDAPTYLSLFLDRSTQMISLIKSASL
jgi:hypothetical protein